MTRHFAIKMPRTFWLLLPRNYVVCTLGRRQMSASKRKGEYVLWVQRC